MANRKELRDARRRVDQATRELAGIEALPRREGQRVRWSNGVVWERIDDDCWLPTSTEGILADHTYSSAHVASGDWERIKTSSTR